MEAKLIINNVITDSASGKKIEIHSPWDSSILGTTEGAAVEQAKNAVQVAVNAFSTWRYSNISDRIALLSKVVEILKPRIQSLGELLSREIGKTKEDAENEIARAIEYLQLTIDGIKFVQGSVYYGDIFNKYPRGKKTGIYSRVPLGVVLAISPFNYPINLSITKIAPALITGNTVVFKPATVGSLTAFEFYKAFIEAGFPAGVFNLVSGDSAEIGDTLLTDPAVALIAFTGSSAVGTHIRQIANGIPLLLELGGKDAAIVTAKADLEVAAKEITSGAFSYAGQRCTAQKIIYVYQDVADALKDKLIAQAQTLNLNPMISASACDYVQGLVDEAVSKGAQLVLPGTRNINVLSPAILFGVTDDMRIFQEEQFGPAMPIVIVTDELEAVAKANSTKYGLQASVYSQDIDEAMRIADKLNVGTVQINAKPDRGPDNFPFGGTKESGQYMQGIRETMDLMTRGKLTVINLHKLI